MTGKRRPQRQSFFGSGVELVPFSALKGKVGSVDFEERTDGALARGQSRPGRQRTGSAEPLLLSETQWAENNVRFGPLWEMGAELDRRMSLCLRSGRRRECLAAEMLFFDVLTLQTGSYRRTDRFLRDSANWDRLRVALEVAYPNDLTKRLSQSPISRTQFSNLRDKVKNDPELMNLVHGFYNEVSCLVTLDVGALSEKTGSFNHPHPSQVVAGDATWLDSKFNSARGTPNIDPTTGEIISRGRFDPDSRSFHNNDRAPGFMIVAASARNMHPHERVILDIEAVPDGKKDAQVFAEFVVGLASRVPGLHGACYDMAARSREVDLLQGAGLHAITKVPRLKGGAIASLLLGEHTFSLVDGTSKSLVVWAVDGSPCIETVVDGEKKLLQLARQQTVRRRGKKKWTLYTIWRIPDSPGMPPHLQSATTMIRHEPTQSEIEKGKPRTNVLRTIAEGDPEFRELFGRREDTESMHHNLKSRLTDRRARCVGLDRNLLNLRAYQMLSAITALTAHGSRTGVHHERWFGLPLERERQRTRAA